MRVRAIALGVAVAVLVAAVAWRNPNIKAMLGGAANMVGVSLTPANSDVETGPSYLISNQPWMFSDPASAVSPSISQQTAGGQPGIIRQFSMLFKTGS